jgi:hypothetical protein
MWRLHRPYEDLAMMSKFVMAGPDGTVVRGYRAAALVDAFNRYLGDVASDSDSLQASDALQATAM